jgi:hypothetical protein
MVIGEPGAPVQLRLAAVDYAAFELRMLAGGGVAAFIREALLGAGPGDVRLQLDPSWSRLLADREALSRDLGGRWSDPLYVTLSNLEVHVREYGAWRPVAIASPRGKTGYYEAYVDLPDGQVFGLIEYESARPAAPITCEPGPSTKCPAPPVRPARARATRRRERLAGDGFELPAGAISEVRGEGTGTIAALLGDSSLLLRTPGETKWRAVPGARKLAVDAIAVGPDGIVVAGSCSPRKTGEEQLHRWDGTTWTALEPPPDEGCVGGMAVTAGGELWVLQNWKIFRADAAGSWQAVPVRLGGIEFYVDQLRGRSDGTVWIAGCTSEEDAARRLGFACIVATTAAWDRPIDITGIGP